MIITPKTRVQTDRLASHVPILATAVNLIDIFQKIHLRKMSVERIRQNHYYSYLDQKSYKRCFVLMIPVIGQIAIYLYDRLKSQKVVQQPRDAVVPQNKDPIEVPLKPIVEPAVPMEIKYPVDLKELEKFMIKECSEADSIHAFFDAHEEVIKKMKADPQQRFILCSLLKVAPWILSRLMSNREEPLYRLFANVHPKTCLHPPAAYMYGWERERCYKTYLEQHPGRNFWKARIDDLPLSAGGIDSYQGLMMAWRLDAEAGRVGNQEESLKYLENRKNAALSEEQFENDLKAMIDFWEPELMMNGPKLKLLNQFLRVSKAPFDAQALLNPHSWDDMEPIFVYPNDPNADKMLDQLKNDPFAMVVPDTLVADLNFMLRAQQILKTDKFAYLLQRSPLIMQDAIYDLMKADTKFLLSSNLSAIFKEIDRLKKALEISPLAWAKVVSVAGSPFGDAVNEMRENGQYRYREYLEFIHKQE